MDFPPTKLNTLAREFPHPMPVAHAGWMETKQTWIRHAFSSLNFSFILEGGGTLRIGDRSWNLLAPCVLVEPPGLYMEYGPDHPHAHWSECFLIYPAECLPHARSARLFSDDRLFWPIRNTLQVTRLLEEIGRCLVDFAAKGAADRIDRLAELAIVESLLDSGDPALSPPEAAVTRLRQFLDRHFARPISFPDLARRHGLTDSTFRRTWTRMMPISPNRYLSELRMREARRLLSQTRLPVADIAARCGYEDPLYFSRRFRNLNGLSPAHYRKLHC